MSTVDVAPQIAVWARWAVQKHGWFNYEEIRPFGLYRPFVLHHITDDCSATVTLLFWLAGVPNDPNGPLYHYDGYGNTETLRANGHAILSGAQTRPGDLVIYFSTANCEPGTSVHTAVIIEPGADPLTVSHGQQGEPGYVYVSEDGRPHLYYRYNTLKPVAVKPPKPAPKPKPVPKRSSLTPDAYAKAQGMVRIDRAEARLGLSVGISYYTWHKGLMVGSRSPTIPTATLFAFAKNLDAHGIPHAAA